MGLWNSIWKCSLALFFTILIGCAARNNGPTIDSSSGLFPASHRVNGKLRSNIYIDRNGNIALALNEGWITGGFCEGLAAVSKPHGERRRLFGFINSSGKLVIPFQFASAGCFEGGFARVSFWEEDKRVGLIDRKGNLISDPKFSWIYPPQEGVAHASHDGKNGYVNLKGDWVIPPYLTHTAGFKEGLARGQKEKDGLYGYINKKNEWVVPPKYDMIVELSEGRGLFRLDNKYGFVDRSGREVISARYEEASSFSNGFARVKENGKFGYIDYAGNYLVRPQFDDATDFSEGVAAASIEKNYFLLQLDGRRIPIGKYERVSKFSEGLAAAKHLGDSSCKRQGLFKLCDYSYINLNGETQFTINAWIASTFKDGVARFSFNKDDIARYVNNEGKIIWPPKGEY